MDFSLSEEQSMIRDSVAHFFAASYPFAKRKEIIESHRGYFKDHWSQFADLGLLGVAIPDQFGGVGGSQIECMLIMEQIGRALVVSPYLSTVVLSSNILLNGDSAAHKSELLPLIAAGELQVSLAYMEPQMRYGGSEPLTKARRNNYGYVLNGSKSVVYFAESADKLIVSASVDSGIADQRPELGLFLVDCDLDGLSFQHYWTNDGGRASELFLADVNVKSDDLVCELSRSRQVLGFVLDIAAASVCAEAVGAMWSVYEQTLSYIKTRQQFGQALGKFQALQHRMVDVYMKCELAQSMVYKAVSALNEDDNSVRARAVSAAKFLIGRYACTVGEEGIQLHGGIGMTDELAIGHYFKRIVLINASFGDPNHSLVRYKNVSA